MSDHPEQPATERAIQTIDLGDREGNDTKLASALEAIANRVSEDAPGRWKVTECLGRLAHICDLSTSKLQKAARWGIKRFTDYEKRLAEADKLRKEGRAAIIKAEAEAELIRAKERGVVADARSTEIKNETAEEILRQLKARCIDMAAAVRDGRVDVAVVKDDSRALPESQSEPE